MNKIYNWFGGRKVFYMVLILLLNFVLVLAGKYNNDFASFCNILIGSYIIGNVAHKKVSQ